MREKLKEVIEHHHTSLPSMEERRDDGIPQTAQGQIPHSESPSLMSEMVPSPTSKKAPPTADFLGSPPQRAVEQRKQKRRARRIALYEEIRTLRMGGHSYQTIADTLGICSRTVRRFVMAEDYPDLNPWPRRGSMLDPYKPYLLQQVQAEHHHTGSQLYSEIQKRGYAGSFSQLKLFLASVQRDRSQALSTSSHASNHPEKRYSTRKMSASRVSWLLISRSEKLTKKQNQQLKRVRKAHPDWEKAYQVSQAFVRVLAEHQVEGFEPWLIHTEQCGIAELQGFAHFLRRDYDAVLAALSLPWSQGQVEGQVNRLKLQKRVMFGRGNFDLLQQRVLYSA